MRDAELTRRARDMRKQLPEPEACLWLQLRAERFEGVNFRRQKVIGKYIVDFAANAPRLVVEIDGDSHAAQAAYDDKRTDFLESEGYAVLRFTNAEVMANMEGVLARLAEAIDRLQAPPPLPPLSPEGERASNRVTNSLSPSGERVGERGSL